jgi:polysaccharide export outer membrane protein
MYQKISLLYFFVLHLSLFVLDKDINKDFQIKEFDQIEFFNRLDTKPKIYATINGEVHNEGEFVVDSDTTFKELIAIAGGLTQKAYKEFELIRYRLEDGIRKQEIQKLSLQKAINNNFKIKAYDEIKILKIPNWDDVKTVTISGEVKFPGEYIINKGDKLVDLLKRVGGFTDNAFIDGMVFNRDSIKILQKERLKDSINKLKQNAAFLAATPTQAGEKAEDKQKLVLIIDNLTKELSSIEPTGRLAMTITSSLEELEQSHFNIILEDKDEIIIPTRNDTVTVMGEVLNTSSFIFTPDKSIDYYLNKAGGATQKADMENIYIVHANGEAERFTSGYLFANNSQIKRGDTIVVPMVLNVTSNIGIVKDVTQIIYQLAITAASLKTVGSL